MYKMYKKRAGIIQFPLIIGLVLIAISLPLATKLVQQNTENRSKAAGCSGSCVPSDICSNYIKGTQISGDCSTSGTICCKSPSSPTATPTKKPTAVPTTANTCSGSCVPSDICSNYVHGTQISGSCSTSGTICCKSPSSPTATPTKAATCTTISSCSSVGGHCGSPSGWSGDVKTGLCPGGNDCVCLVPKAPTATPTTTKKCSYTCYTPYTSGQTSCSGFNVATAIYSGPGRDGSCGSTNLCCNKTVVTPTPTKPVSPTPTKPLTTTPINCPSRCSANYGCQKTGVYQGNPDCDHPVASPNYSLDCSCPKKNGAGGGNDTQCDLHCFNGALMVKPSFNLSANITADGAGISVKISNTANVHHAAVYESGTYKALMNGSEYVFSNPTEGIHSYSVKACSIDTNNTTYNNDCPEDAASSRSVNITYSNEFITYTVCDAGVSRVDVLMFNDSANIVLPVKVESVPSYRSNGWVYATAAQSQGYIANNPIPETCGCYVCPNGQQRAQNKADANCDGNINELDFAAWLIEYQRKSISGKGDFNCKDGVGIEDFSLWNSSFSR